jgi:hypothetical protein
MKTISLIIGIIVMSLFVGYLALAWTGPTATAPGDNVAIPLNTSVTAQSKEGALVLGTNAAVTTALIVQNGNAGIGATSPVGKLNVIPIGNLNSGTTPDVTQAGLLIGTGVGGIAFDINQIESLGDAIYVNLNSTQNISLANGGGNVGIGVTSPGAKLQVKGSTISSSLYVNPIANSYGVYGSSIALNFDSYSLGNSYWTGGSIAYGGEDAAYAGYLWLDENERFSKTSAGVPGSPTMILRGGNVGIGVTSPGAKLEVAGQVKITGGTPVVNDILTSDASGLATWETGVKYGLHGWAKISHSECVSGGESCTASLPATCVCSQYYCAPYLSYACEVVCPTGYTAKITGNDYTYQTTYIYNSATYYSCYKD